MMFHIVLTESAERDLRNIYEYIAYSLLSPANAAAQIMRLEKGILSLENMPERFRRYETEPWFSRGLRIMAVDRYNVFYMIDESRTRVSVVRVLYSGMDAPAYLQH